MRRLRRLRRQIRRLRREVNQLNKQVFSNYVFDPARYTGVWTGIDLAINLTRNEGVNTVKTVVLNCLPNGVITGSVTWSAVTNEGFNAQNQAVAGDTETVRGLVNLSTGAMHLVEEEELGTFTGSVDSNNVLHINQTQPGTQPVVALMTLSKQNA